MLFMVIERLTPEGAGEIYRRRGGGKAGTKPAIFS
jgi:hypothetical protein